METYCPKDKKEWRAWLIENHLKKDSIWIVFYKKSSPCPNLSWSEAVDEALCFGWIDSTKKSIDQQKYMQYFCKRKPKSNWSKVNKEKVTMLIDNGLMRDAGLSSIRVAKENGSWTFLDAIEALIIPEDLKEVLSQHEGSTEYFDSLSKSAKKLLLYWVISGKRKETREKRILEIAENAAQNMMPKQFR